MAILLLLISLGSREYHPFVMESFGIYDTKSGIEAKLAKIKRIPYFIAKNNFAKLSLEEHGLLQVYRES